MSLRLIALAAAALTAFQAHAGEAQFSRLRLTETSITEVGRVDGEDYRMKTKGYGIGYIAPCGFGWHFTSLDTIGDAGSTYKRFTRADLHHDYIDTSYTLGDMFVVTGGFGMGVAGTARYATPSGGEAVSHDFHSVDWFLGPGFSVYGFEVYWIHRRNFPHFGAVGERLAIRSQHYQLGLGFRF